MENEIGYGQEKKYGAIKITKLRNTPCTVSNACYYFSLDSNRHEQRHWWRRVLHHDRHEVRNYINQLRTNRIIFRRPWNRANFSCLLHSCKGHPWAHEENPRTTSWDLSVCWKQADVKRFRRDTPKNHASFFGWRPLDCCQGRGCLTESPTANKEINYVNQHGKTEDFRLIWLGMACPVKSLDRIRQQPTSNSWQKKHAKYYARTYIQIKLTTSLFI